MGRRTARKASWDADYSDLPPAMAQDLLELREEVKGPLAAKPAPKAPTSGHPGSDRPKKNSARSKRSKGGKPGLWSRMRRWLQG